MENVASKIKALNFPEETYPTIDKFILSLSDDCVTLEELVRIVNYLYEKGISLKPCQIKVLANGFSYVEKTVDEMEALGELDAFIEDPNRMNSKDVINRLKYLKSIHAEYKKDGKYAKALFSKRIFEAQYGKIDFAKMALDEMDLSSTPESKEEVKGYYNEDFAAYQAEQVSPLAYKKEEEDQIYIPPVWPELDTTVTKIYGENPDDTSYVEVSPIDDSVLAYDQAEAQMALIPSDESVPELGEAPLDGNITPKKPAEAQEMTEEHSDAYLALMESATQAEADAEVDLPDEQIIHETPAKGEGTLPETDSVSEVAPEELVQDDSMVMPPLDSQEVDTYIPMAEEEQEEYTYDNYALIPYIPEDSINNPDIELIDEYTYEDGYYVTSTPDDSSLAQAQEQGLEEPPAFEEVPAQSEEQAEKPESKIINLEDYMDPKYIGAEDEYEAPELPLRDDAKALDFNDDNKDLIDLEAQFNSRSDDELLNAPEDLEPKSSSTNNVVSIDFNNPYEDILSKPQTIGLNDETFDRYEKLADSIRHVLVSVYNIDEVNDTITDNLIKLITNGVEKDSEVIYYAITFGKIISEEEIQRLRNAIEEELEYTSILDLNIGEAA